MLKNYQSSSILRPWFKHPIINSHSSAYHEHADNSQVGQHPNFRSSRPEMFCKKGVLRNFTKFTGKHLCQSLFFNKVADLKPATLLKKETLAQVFSCEFCKISKSTFFHRTPLVAASEISVV